MWLALQEVRREVWSTFLPFLRNLGLMTKVLLLIEKSPEGGGSSVPLSSLFQS